MIIDTTTPMIIDLLRFDEFLTDSSVVVVVVGDCEGRVVTGLDVDEMTGFWVDIVDGNDEIEDVEGVEGIVEGVKVDETVEWNDGVTVGLSDGFDDIEGVIVGYSDDDSVERTEEIRIESSKDEFSSIEAIFLRKLGKDARNLEFSAITIDVEIEIAMIVAVDAINAMKLDFIEKNFKTFNNSTDCDYYARRDDFVMIITTIVMMISFCLNKSFECIYYRSYHYFKDFWARFFKRFCFHWKKDENRSLFDLVDVLLDIDAC